MDKYTALLTYSKPNMRFLEGRIEDLRAAGVDDGSIDLIISNCVVNLCPDKDKVFLEAYRVLAPGGEMYFSDMYATRRLSAGIANNQVTPDIVHTSVMKCSLPIAKPCSATKAKQSSSLHLNMRCVDAGALGGGSHWSAIQRGLHLKGHQIRICCSKDS